MPLRPIWKQKNKRLATCRQHRHPSQAMNGSDTCTGGKPGLSWSIYIGTRHQWHHHNQLWQESISRYHPRRPRSFVKWLSKMYKIESSVLQHTSTRIDGSGPVRPTKSFIQPSYVSRRRGCSNSVSSTGWKVSGLTEFI